MHITAQDVKKLSNLSQIDLSLDEQKSLQKNLESILEYALRVRQIAHESTRVQQNVQACRLREDEPAAFDARDIMAQAPEKIENFFVVPKII